MIFGTCCPDFHIFLGNTILREWTKDRRGGSLRFFINCFLWSFKNTFLKNVLKEIKTNFLGAEDHRMARSINCIGICSWDTLGQKVVYVPFPQGYFIGINARKLNLYSCLMMVLGIETILLQLLENCILWLHFFIHISHELNQACYHPWIRFAFLHVYMDNFLSQCITPRPNIIAFTHDVIVAYGSSSFRMQSCL